VLGIAAYATLRGITAVLARGHGRRRGAIAGAGAGPALAARAATGMSRGGRWRWCSGWVSGWRAARAGARQEGRSADNLLGGWASAPWWPLVWWVSGRLGHVAEHPQTLEEAFLATNSRAWSRSPSSPRWPTRSTG
jgi:hypothetical protein